MKILVSVKRVVDPDARIKITPDGRSIDTEGAEYRVNYFDENAVEEALRLKEKHDAEVVVVSIGPEDVTQTLRAALAMGADRGVRVDYTDDRMDSDLAARILAAVFDEEEADIFILGKQAIDGDNNQVGQLVAEYLELPQACFASAVTVDPDAETATVTTEVDGGLMTFELDLPCVITADLRLNEPRYASLPGIMKAKKKPLDVKTLQELEIEDTDLKIEVVRLEEPPKKQAGMMVDSVDALIAKLKNEARVI